METFLTLFITVIVFALGAAIGSFLNVVVYRLPAGLSLLYPPSRCPKCLHPLRARENVPVLGWLWLRGRCAHCKTKISARYPTVEAVTGLLFVLVFGLFGVSWQTIGYWTFFAWLVALALIDLDTMTLPDPLTQSGLVVGLAYQAIAGWQTTGSWVGAIQYLVGGVIGAVLGIWLLDGIALVASVALGQTAMGAGDAKLAAMMGTWLGWKLLLLAGLLACGLGAVIGVGAITLGLLRRRQAMPFGPFLALGAIAAALWGDRVLSFYFSLFTSNPGL
ncbi:MAG TPA: prepilin peptidase [Leptolyngbyaceae cyanobacterium M33_DOE_097]|uniref:Prepilin leader peptidase/N-methyltransferase n=1 Tax=Oscillatoriales cyanobacterium SpSt-418 TaxID=2282169 RepID=A0A7C3PLK0_9CYAN|nr:prepilin peptidase [Leptolyngbyaceae cyanobacterium M33_DOE_097]